MTSVRVAAIVAAIAVAGAQPALSQEPPNSASDALDQAQSLPWTRYPATVNLADHASVALAQGLEYLGSEQSARFIELEGNPRPNVPTYIISKDNFRWFSVFTFDESGYVRDDEKIDPDRLLSALQDGNRKSADRRRELGLSPLTLVGWYVPPHYDQSTHRLEWGTKLVDDQNRVTVNYTVRLLARRGVMSATLISDPSRLDADMVEFKSALDDVKFDSGQSYSEFRPGDKVAAYGLGALVLGGAAAAAVKGGALGFIKALWVGALAAGAAVLNWFKNLFTRRRKA